MPVYEYQCKKCGKVFEILHGINESYQDGCPWCRGEAKRILSPSNFILRGPGFYVNDYPSEGRKRDESKEKKADSGEKKTEKSTATKEDRTGQPAS
jgi:putative FmdB family regulatory protein